MNKLSTLLAQRARLLRQARLAALALAHETLRAAAERIARARLAGSVTLAPADPDAGLYCATLAAHEGSQAVLDEHFTDESLLDLCDAIALARDQPEGEVTFRLEELAEDFLLPLRAELEREGIVIDVLALRTGADR